MKPTLKISVTEKFWLRGAHAMGAPFPAIQGASRSGPAMPCAPNGHQHVPPDFRLHHRLMAWWHYHFTEVAFCAVHGPNGGVYFRADQTPPMFRQELQCRAFKTEFMTCAAFDRLPASRKG